VEDRNRGYGEAGVEESLAEMVLPIQNGVDVIILEDVSSAKERVHDGEEAVDERESQRPDEISGLELRLAAEEEHVGKDDDGVEAVLVLDVNVIKLFTAVIYEFTQQARLFITCKVFADKSGAYPSEIPFRCSTLGQVPGLTHKH